MSIIRICKECGFPITDDPRIAREQAVCCCIKPKIGLAVLIRNQGERLAILLDNQGDRRMKQFENWQKKALKGYLSPNVYLGAELGWKAALEWIVKTTDEHYYAFEDKFDVIKMIKEELNATSEKRG